MTRRQFLAAGLGSAGVIAAMAHRFGESHLGHSKTLDLDARSRDKDGDVIREALQWWADQTAIIICDMWDDHYCLNAVSRLQEMIPQMNQVTRRAREHGVKIIHAPSSTMDFYAGAPQRERMIEAPAITPPVPIGEWCYLDPKSEAALPIDDEEPCDDQVLRERKRFYNRQHPDLEIAEADGISDDGQEIFNYFEQHSIENVVLMGVHTNKCVLGRPFGIRQQVRLGKNVVLARDLTDSMYDPRDEPFVSHEQGTELIIEHIERYWCPTIRGADLAQGAAVSQPASALCGLQSRLVLSIRL